MKTNPTPASSPATNDSTALWLGIAFSLAFTTLIWALGSRLDRFPLLPDQGAAWYYWKLPSPTFWSRASAWGLYLLHQFALWGLIFYAQRRQLGYTNRLHPVNVVALGLNAGFIFLHLLQTHLWYDGLAQDVSIFSSQASVVVLLIWVLLMENPRRGLFWGKKVPISKQIIAWARKYHGYFFSWACTPLLVSLVGPGNAKDLVLTRRQLTADEAVGMNLANMSVASDLLLTASEELVGRMRTGGPLAMRMAKKLVNASSPSWLGDVSITEPELIERLYTAGEPAEGSAAFFQKRAPRWRDDG